MFKINDLETILSGKKEPEGFPMTFVVNQFGDAMVYTVKNFPEFADVMGGEIMLDNMLTDTKRIPVKRGMYSCILMVTSYQCNNFDDPVEWDMNIWIKDVKKIK
jgi:hypothetical protein